MKRTQLFLIIIGLLITCLGCKPGSSSELDQTTKPVGTQRPTPTATIAATPTFHPDLQVSIDDLQGEKLVFWHSLTGDSRAIIRAQVNEFNQNNEWGIFVEIQDFSGFDLIRETLNNTDDYLLYPNVLTAPPEFLVANSASSPAIIPLDHYVESSQYGIGEPEDYYEAIWLGDMDGGARFGFPAYRTAQVMFYNQVLASELGFDAHPTMIEEWKNQSCTAALNNNSDSDKKNDGTGGWIVDLHSETWMSWIAAFRENPVAQDTGLLFSTAENEMAFQFIREVFDDGCAWFPREQKAYEYLRDGYTLFYSTALENVLIQEQFTSETFAGEDWSVVPFPGMEGDNALVVHGYSYGIFENSPETQLASWLFIRWMQEPQRLAEIVKASASLPLRKTEMALLAGYGGQHPQWMGIVEYLEDAQPALSAADWQISQLVLEDVAWQSLQANVTSADIPNLLRQADEIVAEIKTQTSVP